MKRLVLALALLAASGGVAMAADSPFAGAWKLNPAHSNFTGDTFTYSKTASGYHFSDGAAFDYDFATDGKAYPTIANRTVAWTKAGDDAWDTETKAGTTVIGRSHRTLSADGKTLTIEFTEYRLDGTTAKENNVYSRVSGTQGLVGEWKNVKSEPASSTMVITTPAPGKFEIQTPAYKQTIKGSTDGSPADAQGPLIPPGASAMYKAAGPSEWDYAFALKGKPVVKGVMTVSADGKSLTDTSWSPGKETEKAVAVYDKQ